MTPEALEEKEKIQCREGILKDGIIPGNYGYKFSGFPWFLAFWYQDNFEDEQEGTFEDIGYHARFNVTEDTRKEYSPDIPENVVGYIVREDSQGFMYFESYETEEDYTTAWNSVLEAMESFHTCGTCDHINYNNGDGCDQGESNDLRCPCQECPNNDPHEKDCDCHICGDNPKKYAIYWNQPRISYAYANSEAEAREMFFEDDTVSGNSEIEMGVDDTISEIREVEEGE